MLILLLPSEKKGKEPGPAITVYTGVASLEISSPASWWTCYTKDPTTFCVEPLNAPPDAVRLNRLVGNTHNLDVIFTFEINF